MATSSRPIQSVSNAELYNRWAEVYDTDGNILQSLDDLLFPPLLSRTLSQISSTLTTHSPTILTTELGCGTGRNTLKLLFPPSTLPSLPITSIHALDLSPHMLTLASENCTPSPIPLRFYEFDALHSDAYPEVQLLYHKANLVISTLVLEHLPLTVFFQTVHNLLQKSGGWLILTNMHQEMGNISRAGFKDPKTGEKIQGTSFVYSIQEVLDEGRKWGFVIQGEVEERGVEEGDLEGGVVGSRGRKWVGVKCWFGGVFRFEGEV